jgi:hypothetical protein
MGRCGAYHESGRSGREVPVGLEVKSGEPSDLQIVSTRDSGTVQNETNCCLRLIQSQVSSKPPSKQDAEGESSPLHSF